MHRFLYSCRVIPVVAYFSSNKCNSESENGKKLSYCSSNDIRLNDSNNGGGFYIQYDSRTRNPKYVVQRFQRSITKGEEGGNRSKSHFKAEQQIQVDMFRVKPTDYNNSGFDRGHMVPASDFSYSQEALNSTFTMANMCPQSPQLNKGLWARLEAWLRYIHIQHKEFEELIVITGPVYAPILIQGEWVHINRTIGTFPKLIHVPTHFFKIVLALNKNSNELKITEKFSILNAFDTQKSSNALPPGGGSFIGAFLVPNNDNVDTKVCI